MGYLIFLFFIILFIFSIEKYPKKTILASLVLICLTLGFCSIQGSNRFKKDKKWCEQTIDEYETSKTKFIEKHSKEMLEGHLSLRPNKNSPPLFRLDPDGYYECWCGHPGIVFPHSYKYDSISKKWVYMD